MRTLIILSFLSVFASALVSQTTPKVDYFNLQDVKLLDSPFKHAQDLDKQYMLDMEADRLLAPFLREAGLKAKAESYTNWENTGLDGHIGGHYLSALSLMYASTGDSRIKERLDYMLSELKRVQDANGNGYIGGVPGSKALWAEIGKGDIRAGGFDLNGKWVPLYNIHKTYAGLRDAYLHANSELAKEMLVKMTDWMLLLTQNLTDEQMQDMLRSEHGGLNETFADVAAITGHAAYLELGRRFSHHYLLDPLLNKEDKLTGMHANTQIPKVLGFKRVADVEGNNSWSDGAQFFWQSVTDHRSVCIGGNSVSEHFNPIDNYSQMVKTIEGPETCNSYNMLRLSRMFYQTTLDKKYIEFYEQGLYNHILSTQNPHTGGFVYFTQMRPGHYRIYSQPQTSFWCCVGSGLENHAKYGEMIYAHGKNDLYVNLFIPSRLEWKDKQVEVIQETTFPDEEEIRFTVNLQKNTSFALNLRCPEWTDKSAVKLSINGQYAPVQVAGNGYIRIDRKWKKGDQVTVTFPMDIHPVQMPDKSNYYAFFYGPIALAAKTSVDGQPGLFADDSRGGHIAHGHRIPLREMPILVSDPNNLVSNISPVYAKPVTFRLSGLYSDTYPSSMELIPFFRLHESRYIIYWPQSTKEGVEALKKQIEKEEQEQIKLDAITIDKVVCGEQQPESDHFIQSQDSWTGFLDDYHWREARGWFGYQLKNNTQKAQSIYLKYFNRDKGRTTNIYINDQLMNAMTSTDVDGDYLQTVKIPIPADQQTKDVLNIKFDASGGTMTAKIVEIRIITEN